jgi:hypothetical protein
VIDAANQSTVQPEMLSAVSRLHGITDSHSVKPLLCQASRRVDVRYHLQTERRITDVADAKFHSRRARRED